MKLKYRHDDKQNLLFEIVAVHREDGSPLELVQVGLPLQRNALKDEGEVKISLPNTLCEQDTLCFIKCKFLPRKGEISVMLRTIAPKNTGKILEIAPTNKLPKNVVVSDIVTAIVALHTGCMMAPGFKIKSGWDFFRQFRREAEATTKKL